RYRERRERAVDEAERRRIRRDEEGQAVEVRGVAHRPELAAQDVERQRLVLVQVGDTHLTQPREPAGGEARVGLLLGEGDVGQAVDRQAQLHAQVEAVLLQEVEVRLAGLGDRPRRRRAGQESRHRDRQKEGDDRGGRAGESRQRVSSAAGRTTRPSFITKETLSRAVTSPRGSRGTATTSARLPTSRVPVSFSIPSTPAALAVADLIAPIGDRPRRTMRANSRLAVSWGKIVSEPKAIVMPAANAARIARSRSACNDLALAMRSAG